MAEVKKYKRKIYYTCSTGEIGSGKPDAAKEFKVPCPWTPGKSRKRS